MSRGDYFGDKDQVKEHFCVFLSFEYCFYCVFVPGHAQYISYPHGMIYPVCAENAVKLQTNQPDDQHSLVS